MVAEVGGYAVTPNTVVAVLIVMSTAYGFHSGWLPAHIKRLIGFYELKEEVVEVKDNTENLKASVTTLKHGQLAIAETVEEEHNSVRVDRLREAHFGAEGHSDDFLRGGG